MLPGDDVCAYCEQPIYRDPRWAEQGWVWTVHLQETWWGAGPHVAHCPPRIQKNRPVGRERHHPAEHGHVPAGHRTLLRILTELGVFDG